MEEYRALWYTFYSYTVLVYLSASMIILFLPCLASLQIRPVIVCRIYRDIDMKFPCRCRRCRQYPSMTNKGGTCILRQTISNEPLISVGHFQFIIQVLYWGFPIVEKCSCMLSWLMNNADEGKFNIKVRCTMSLHASDSPWYRLCMPQSSIIIHITRGLEFCLQVKYPLVSPTLRS